MKGFPDLPPLWLLAFLIIGWALSTYLPIWSFGTDLSVLLGLAVGAAGLSLILWSAVWFRRKKTTIEPHHIPTRLIIEGPYKITRNPIYLGMATILAGGIFYWGALSTLPLPLLFVYVIQSRFVEPEEIALFTAFEEEALDYISRTRRWL